jgi:hypothetical protein
MLSALDVGSSFEGMGAAREASFSAFVEPALFLLIGSAAMATGQTSFAGLIGGLQGSASFALAGGACRRGALHPAAGRSRARAGGRPADPPRADDDPRGDGARPQRPRPRGHAVGGRLEDDDLRRADRALLNPFDPFGPGLAPLAAVATSLALMAGVAVAVGCVESLTARLRLRLVPQYLMLASVAAGLCLAIAGSTWSP